MSINSSLIAQMIVFLILVWFTMKFVWPPIMAALDERARKVAEGLSAADKARAELSVANQRVEQQLAQFGRRRLVFCQCAPIFQAAHDPGAVVEIGRRLLALVGFRHAGDERATPALMNE